MNDYSGRLPKLLKSFDRSLGRARNVLITHFGPREAEAMTRESRREYETIIPRIPFIGHRNPLLMFLLPVSRHLAVYRILRGQGLTVEAAGRILSQMNDAELDSFPDFLCRLVEYLWFSSLFKMRVRKRAAESQQRLYPDGYALTYVEGDGVAFDYGLDYTECAGCKFLTKVGAPELAPFMCALDQAVSERFGWGLKRTMTIAEGFEKCDFRFKKGGKTNIKSQVERT